MLMQCEDHRKQILKLVLGDISPEEHESLKVHLVECPSCSQERDVALDTVQQLRSATDVSVPRHFFVYPEETGFSPWSLFQNLSLAWKAAVITMVLATGGLSGLAMANFYGQAEGGRFTISFGKPLEPKVVRTSPTVNIEGLKAELLRVLEERSQEEHQLWVQDMRQELARSKLVLTRKQRKLVDSALAGLETRFNHQISTRELALQTGWKQSMTDLYQTIQTQRRQDLVLTKNRLDRLAVQGEMRSTQTDAILETLLQVAEMRMK
jgi:hypothetical protein